MNAKEMFDSIDYNFEVYKNDKSYIEYRDYSHGDGDYAYVKFYKLRKFYEVGYYDGYETKENKIQRVEIELHQAITQQMKELGWIE